MVPHKTPRGAASLDRLKTYEGIPHPFDISSECRHFFKRGLSRPCFFSFSEIVLDRIFLAAAQHVHTHLLKDSTSKRLLTDRKDVHFCLELQLVELASKLSNPKLPQSISNANSLAC